MNAADYYRLDELKSSCFGFIEVCLLFQSCITVDTVCALLATADRYIQYKCTKFLIQKVKIIIPLIFNAKFRCWSSLIHTAMRS